MLEERSARPARPGVVSESPGNGASLPEAGESSGNGRSSEERYRLLAENSTDVVMITDPQAVMLFVSPAISQMLGYEPEELVGRSAYELIHPEDLAASGSVVAGMLDSLRPLNTAPYRTRRKDGTYIWVESNVRPVLDGASGEVIEMQTSHRNVTQRREAELRLRRSEHQLTVAQRLARIGSWEWDIDADRVSWSDQLYEIFGLSPGEFGGSLDAYLERVLPEDRERVAGSVGAAVEQGTSFHYECRIVLPDGGVRVIEAYGEVLEEPGRSRKMIGTAQDITGRKRAAEELAATHQQLERRTKELERSNLELEQFAYDASHDLGEPLRVMSRLAGALAEQYGDRLDDDGRRLVTSISDGSERMQMLISDLLEYSRVAREPLERSWVDCNAAYKEAIELLAESIAEKGAFVVAVGLPTIEVNRTQFRQLLQNLLSNALKFAGDESLRIEVTARRAQGEWLLTVADNGIGIEPHQAERVFELFRRLKPNDAYAGTGMGLAICKRIVDRHGGRIWVESAERGGSVFCFTIPDRQTGLEAALCGGS